MTDVEKITWLLAYGAGLLFFTEDDETARLIRCHLYEAMSKAAGDEQLARDITGLYFTLQGTVDTPGLRFFAGIYRRLIDVPCVRDAYERAIEREMKEALK